MANFAVAEDVEVRWRPLTADERTVVTVLIADAEDMIRTRFPDVDARVAAGSLLQVTVVRIVAGMVRRAMLNRDSDGVAAGSETVGPFAQSHTFVNPSGNLYLSADDVRALGLAGYTVTARMEWLV